MRPLTRPWVSYRRPVPVQGAPCLDDVLLECFLHSQRRPSSSGNSLARQHFSRRRPFNKEILWYFVCSFQLDLSRSGWTLGNFGKSANLAILWRRCTSLVVLTTRRWPNTSAQLFPAEPQRTRLPQPSNSTILRHSLSQGGLTREGAGALPATGPHVAVTSRPASSFLPRERSTNHRGVRNRSNSTAVSCPIQGSTLPLLSS